MGSDLLAASSESFSQGMSSVGSALGSFGDTQDAYSSEQKKELIEPIDKAEELHVKVKEQ